MGKEGRDALFELEGLFDLPSLRDRKSAVQIDRHYPHQQEDLQT